MKIIKDFDEMTEKEKEILLKQIQQNLPEDENAKGVGCDLFDLFTQSVNEISKTWSDSLKEFEALYPGYMIEDETNPLKKYESKWTEKIRRKLF